MSNQDRQVSRQLARNLLAPEFGKVYLRDDGATRHVEFSLLMPELDGADAEGWQTGVALDASASMKNWYGRNLSGSIPDSEQVTYKKKGWIKEATHDGKKVISFTREAYDDAMKRGFVKFTDNIVEELARDFIGYLAGSLDADGGTTVVYWACGADGSEYEVVGDFTEDECRQLEIKGPKKVSFGNGTRLTPAVKYFVDRFHDAAKGIYVFLTDGRIDDMPELKRYTTELAKSVAAGKQNPVKCVLVGLGNDVDESQMSELDDLDTGTEVDIWDHKIAADLRGVHEVLAELVDENKIVAPTAVVYDSSGNAVHTFADGLPAKASFSLPTSSDYFELEVGSRRVRQPLA